MSIAEHMNVKEDSEQGYPGVEGGTEEAKAEEKKKKTTKKKTTKKKTTKKKYGPEGSESPDTPEEVQAKLSGTNKSTQYGEATETKEGEEAPEQDATEQPISKEDFFKSIEDFTKILGGDKKSKKKETPKASEK